MPESVNINVNGQPKLHSMNDRPVNLPLLRLFAAMPVTAMASILHRLTGVVLFLAAFYLCYLLDLALDGEQGFQRAAAIVAAPLGKFGLWLVLAALGYHLIAGFKHLLLDFHVGDSAAGGRVGTWLVLLSSALAAILAGLWLW